MNHYKKSSKKRLSLIILGLKGNCTKYHIYILDKVPQTSLSIHLLLIFA